MKKVAIFCGGTVSFVANHLAVCAPAYGTTGEFLYRKISQDIIFGNGIFKDFNDIDIYRTKMAGGEELETNEDVTKKLEEVLADKDVKIIFFNCALVDYEPDQLVTYTWHDITGDNIFHRHINEFGKYNSRLNTRTDNQLSLSLIPSKKIINSIKTARPDVVLVAFKTTCGADGEEMRLKGLKLLEETKSDLVLVNDTKTRSNRIIGPKGILAAGKDRDWILSELINIACEIYSQTFKDGDV